MTPSLEEKIVELTTIAFGVLEPSSAAEPIYENLREIHRVHPKFIDRAYRLLTTGTPTGREEARLAFTMVSGMSAVGQTIKERRESLFRQASATYDSMYLKWNCGNVVEEAGIIDRFSFTLLGMIAYDNQLLKDDHELTKNRDDSYWHGLAVMASVLERYDEPLETSEAGPFLQWVTTRPNASDIVNLSIDRGITNWRNLRDIVESKSELPVPVHSGYL